LTRFARPALAAGAAVLFAVPLVLMVTGSLRRPGMPPPRGPELFPEPATLAAYERAFELVDLGRYAANSLLVAAIAVPLAVLFASWAGFAISQLPPRLSRALLALSFVALMVPTTALLVPRFAIFRTLGLVDTYVPLVAPALLGMSPFYVVLYWWSFHRLPADLFDAGRVDGAGPFRLWWRVAMPLVQPATATVAVFAFVVTWANFLDPLLYLFNEDRYTLPLGLRSLAALDRQDLPVLLAGATLATVPVVLAVVPYTGSSGGWPHEARGSYLRWFSPPAPSPSLRAAATTRAVTPRGTSSSSSSATPRS
jgi:multiple sugar transport system permease protein